MATYELIAKTTLGSDAKDITLSNIPQTGYTDLVLLASSRATRSGQVEAGMALTFNGDTSSIYSYRRLAGEGNTVNSASASAIGYVFIGRNTGASATANTFTSTEIYIPNYAGSANKSFSSTSVHETNATVAYINCIAGLWASTSAITSITLFDTESGSNLLSGSSFYLFGIKKA